MAQTTIAEPQSFTPAYNPIKYLIDSTNKNLTGFKYIFEVYAGATRIGRFPILPRIGDGYGEIDLSKFLSSYVSWDFEPFNITDYKAENCFFDYKLNVGEEYLAEFNYTAALTNSGGNVRINVTNTFVTGDQVNILQADGGTANPLVEGLHAVTASSSTWFEIGVAWSSVTDVNINGSVTYADNRTIVNYGITGFVGQVFNGAFKWVEFPNYDATDYTLNANTKLWLTNQPKTEFNATLAQDIWLNAKAKPQKLFFINSNGDEFTKPIGNTSSILGLAVGPNNYGTLSIVSGTLPLIKPDTTWYEVYYLDAGQKSIAYRINLDRRQSIDEYDIVFLDRLGSMSSFAFQLRTIERGEIQRDEYNKDVQGYVTGGEWKYNAHEYGFNTYFVSATKTLELTTNWMNDEMSQYFEQLLTSPQCYMKRVTYDCDEVTSEPYVPVILTTNNYEVFRQKNKNLIKYTIVVKLANNDVING